MQSVRDATFDEDVGVLRLSEKIRRLAALAQTGQPWDEPLLAGEYQAWLEVAQSSSQPHVLLQRLARYCDEVERLRTEAGRLLSYPRLVLVYLALLSLGLLWMVPGVAVLLGLTLGAFFWSRDPELAWRWLGRRGRARFEQVLWCGHLAQLLELGMDLPRACHWAARGVREASLRLQAEGLEERLLAGDTLAVALQPGDWEPLIVWAAEAARDHEALPGALSSTSRALEEDLREDISATLAWLQPVALSLVAVLILATMAVFWLNYQAISLQAAG